MGSHSGDDAIILTENDSHFCIDITSTKDGKFITVNSNSRTSSEEGTTVSVLLYVCVNVNSEGIFCFYIFCSFSCHDAGLHHKCNQSTTWAAKVLQTCLWSPVLSGTSLWHFLRPY